MYLNHTKHREHTASQNGRLLGRWIVRVVLGGIRCTVTEALNRTHCTVTLASAQCLPSPKWAHLRHTAEGGGYHVFDYM